jgi:hypothetical protein
MGQNQNEVGQSEVKPRLAAEFKPEANDNGLTKDILKAFSDDLKSDLGGKFTEVNANVTALKGNVESLKEGVTRIEGSILPYAPLLAHKDGPEALKTVMATALHMQGKHDEAFQLKGEQKEEGLKGYYQQVKVQVELPITPMKVVKTAVGGALLATVFDGIVAATGLPLPETGVWEFVKGIFGGDKKRR